MKVWLFLSLLNMSRINQNDNKKELITTDIIFSSTDGGLDIFKKHLPYFNTRKNIKSPFQKDNNPSCRLKKSATSGLWLLHVYNGTGGFYNAIQFIEKYYSLTFIEAINFITGDIRIEAKPPKIKESKIIRKNELSYEYSIIPFQKEHLDYYCCCDGLTEKFLNDEMDIFAIDKYAINKKVITFDDGRFMFIYLFKNINKKLTGKVKILNLGPNVDKKDKWRNNILPYKLFYTYKIKGDEKFVFICKSNKDAAITQLCGITSLAVMSENSYNIATALRGLIEKFPNIKFVLNLGSDSQAVETSVPLSKEFNLSWFNTPKRLLSMDINDNFSYVKKFGLNSFKQLLKNKKYIE